MTNRIMNHPVLAPIDDHDTIVFTFNGVQYKALKHESIAAALLANGIRTLRYHEESGAPRGIYCNIGHCFECRVTVDGVQGQRACLTPVEQNMKVESRGKLPTDVRDWRTNNEK